MAIIKIPIQLGDPAYFCNKSWTLSYNFITNSWISFHTYIPNFYIAENNFFYSGINDCCTAFDFIVGVPVSQTECYLGNCTCVVINDDDSTVYDCTLEAAVIEDGPYCELDGATADGWYNCNIEGNAYELYDDEKSGDLCDIPNDLTTFYFIYGYTNNIGTTDSSTSLNEACDAVTYHNTFGDEYIDVTFNVYQIQAFSINEGERVYWIDSVTCECIPDGWYFTEESALSNTIFHVEECIITEIVDTCGQTTTTTTTSPEEAPECYLEATVEFYEPSEDCEYNGGEVEVVSCSNGYSYNVAYYTCNDCENVGDGILCNEYQLTIGKWYYDSYSGLIIHVIDFIECGCEDSEHYILDETKKNSCAEIDCGITTTTSSTTTTTTTVLPETIYGYVYNWWAAIGDTDGDNISDKELTSSDSWQLPSNADWVVLADHVDPDWTFLVNTIGSQLKEIGFSYWQDSGNPVDYGTNTDSFDARGAGTRSFSSGNFSDQTIRLLLWRTEEYTSPTYGMIIQMIYSSGTTALSKTNPLTGDLMNKENGNSIRLVKNVTTLSDGETGIYIGNDGKAYPTICIGTQEWLQVNLEETKWRDGTSIPQVGWDAAGNAEWIAATSAAMSIP